MQEFEPVGVAPSAGEVPAVVAVDVVRRTWYQDAVADRPQFERDLRAIGLPDHDVLGALEVCDGIARTEESLVNQIRILYETDRRKYRHTPKQIEELYTGSQRVCSVSRTSSRQPMSDSRMGRCCPASCRSSFCPRRP